MCGADLSCWDRTPKLELAITEGLEDGCWWDLLFPGLGGLPGINLDKRQCWVSQFEKGLTTLPHCLELSHRNAYSEMSDILSQLIEER